MTEVSMEKKIKISFPTDAHGLIGRECHSCGGYFKVKGGTGLHTSECMCPYCGHKDLQNEFLTAAQIEYAKSVAVREVMGPELRKLEQTLRDLERSTKGGFLQIKVSLTGLDFPLRYYRERDLETSVTCDSCGLEFAIYGVFANCPDCGRLNALTMLTKSIEVAGKKLNFLDSQESLESELKEAVLSDALGGAVSSFDGFGKGLRAKYPEMFLDQPRNLFQNLPALSACLEKSLGTSLQALIGNDEEYKSLVRWFQVRHVYEHNMGVVDDDFLKKVGGYDHLRGKKYPLDRKEIEKMLKGIKPMAEKIMSLLPARTE
jgi:hypothetical protein